MKSITEIRWSSFLKISIFSFLVSLGLLLSVYWYWPSISWMTNPIFWNLEVQKGQGKYQIVGYYNGSREGEIYKIGTAVVNTKDGSLDKYPRVVLDVRDGKWDSRHVKDPYVLEVGDRYYMFYSGTGGNSGYEIGLAVSWDGLRFSRKQEEPVLVQGPSQEWDSRGVSFPVVWLEELTWRMIYSGLGPDGKMGLGLAESDDGVHWSKSKKNPILQGDRLIAGDKLEDAIYFGKKVGNLDEAWVGILEEDDTIDSTKRILNSDWNITPRAVQFEKGGCSMIPTLFTDPILTEPLIREKTGLAYSKDCYNWQWKEGAPLGEPDSTSRRWDAVSAENFAWIRRYKIEPKSTAPKDQ